MASQKRKGILIPKVSPGALLGMNPIGKIQGRKIVGAQKAYCHPKEMQITVRRESKANTIRRLKSLGYTVLGTSYEKPGSKTKSIWFY